IALVIGGVIVALAGGGGDNGTTSGGGAAPPPTATAANVVGCGKKATRTDIARRGIHTPCDQTTAHASGGAPLGAPTVEGGEPTDTLVFGTPCAIHDATPDELAANTDPTNGFVGKSLIGVPIAGLQPGALVEVVLTAPDGTLRTGRAIADGQGYAEV